MILRIRTSLWYVVAYALLAIPSSAHTQSNDPLPMEWESIPPADLAMTTFPADTNASAVVLCDYGESRLNDNMGLVHTRHKRIKILKAGGYDWGTYAVTVYTEKGIEHFKDLEGITYSLGPDGNVVTTELDDESVFEEDVNGKYTRYRFTMPALQPGCVIEFRYTISSETIWWMQDWQFQTSIPVLWSEYRVLVPNRISYTAVTRTFEPFFVETQTVVKQRFTGETASFLGEPMPNCTQYRWVMKNLPAMREEPFITTMDDYCARVDLQLAAYALPYGGVERVLGTWEALIKELVDRPSYKAIVDPASAVRKATEQAIAGQTTPEEKAAAIYNYIRNTIVWSGGQTGAPESDPDEVLESKKGTNADITYLLIAMLRAAGIPADPVIVSTRSNGRIQDQYPIITQFNYVLASATVGSKKMFLDATDPLRPMHLPPVKVLNVQGLIIAPGPVRWATIKVPYYALSKSSAAVTLNPQGELRGTVETVDEDYSSLARRRELKDKAELEVAKKLFDADKVGLTIDSVFVGGKDSVDRPLHTKAWVSSSSYAQVAGDMIYVNPFIVGREFTNPFTLEDRKFSVDMAYFRRAAADIRITVPDGYEVKELPKNRTWSVGRGDAIFSRTITVEKNVIQLQTTMEIRQIEFPPSLYGQLKKFYGDVVTAQAEQVVLKRAPASLSQGRK